MHQNVAGLLSKSDDLEIVLAEMLTNKIHIDIICLSETFLKDGQESNVHMRNYELASHFSRKNKKRGGVCILIRKGMKVKPIPVLSSSAIERHFECCGIEVQNSRFRYHYFYK